MTSTRVAILLMLQSLWFTAASQSFDRKDFATSGPALECDIYAIGVKKTTACRWICNAKGSGEWLSFADDDVEVGLDWQDKRINPETAVKSKDGNREVIPLIIPNPVVGDAKIRNGLSGMLVRFDHVQRNMLQSSSKEVVVVRVGSNSTLKSSHFFSSTILNLNLHRGFVGSLFQRGQVPDLVPSGEKVQSGITDVEIKLNMTDLHFAQVMKSVDPLLQKMEHFSNATKILLMPNELDFRGGDAWATLAEDVVVIKTEAFLSYLKTSLLLNLTLRLIHCGLAAYVGLRFIRLNYQCGTGGRQVPEVDESSMSSEEKKNN